MKEFKICSLVMVIWLIPELVFMQCTYESEVLAIDVSGALLAPDSLSERIATELSTIREYSPSMASICAIPDAELGRIIIQLDSQALTEYFEGNYHGMDNLNTTYGPVTYQYIGLGIFVMDFELNYNPEVLSDIYSTADGVMSAEPDYYSGNSGDISLDLNDSNSSYTFRYGTGDCSSGCNIEHFWYYSLLDSEIISSGNFGDPIMLANFRADPRTGESPLPVHFTDQSLIGLNGNVSWYWDFNSDGTIDSYEQHPDFSFSSNGYYNVTLTVYVDELSEMRIRQNYIFVYSLGDFNFDNIVDVGDIVIIVELILFSPSQTEDQLMIGDLNQDGMISVSDIVMIVDMILER